MKRYKARLDVLYYIPLQEFLIPLHMCNIKIEDFQPIGPGGGNPCLTLSGTPSGLLCYLREYHGLSAVEAAQMMEEIP